MKVNVEDAIELVLINAKKDLEYSQTFNLFLNSKIDAKEYIDHPQGFRRFTWEWQVARTIRVKDKEQFVEIIKIGLNNKVDFDSLLQQLTKFNGISPKSLLSKMFFLSDMEKYIPLDRFAIFALEDNNFMKNSNYKDYQSNIIQFQSKFHSKISDAVKTIRKKQNEFTNIKLFTDEALYKRLTDKWLWSEGAIIDGNKRKK